MIPSEASLCRQPGKHGIPNPLLLVSKQLNSDISYLQHNYFFPGKPNTHRRDNHPTEYDDDDDDDDDDARFRV
jgi:hypothetical protein